MASGVFFDPLALLRIAPLLSSTGQLVHALCELTSNSAFLQPSIRAQSEAVLPGWYRYSFNRQIWSVVGLNLVSISSAIANLVLDSESLKSRGTWGLYALGLAATVGHLAFAPLVAYRIRDMVEDRSKGHATRDMEGWLRVHKVRMVVADLTAWLAYMAAVGGSVRVH